MKLYHLVWKLRSKELFKWLLIRLKAKGSQYCLMIKKICTVKLKESEKSDLVKKNQMAGVWPEFKKSTSKFQGSS